MAQITKIFTEEYYDKVNPRFELELFTESEYDFSYSITKKSIPTKAKLYSPIKKTLVDKKVQSIIAPKPIVNTTSNINNSCNICNKTVISDDYIKADNGKTIICKKCFKKLF